MPSKITQEQYITQCKNVHKDYYLYNNSLYNKMSDKIEIICPEHGIFYQKAQHHILGRGCSDCSRNKKITKERLVRESISIYGNIFDYTKSFFEKRTDVIEINHIIFGNFSQRLDTHIIGKLPDRLKCLISIQEKIKKFKSIECSDYLNYKSNLFQLECHEHGWFEVNTSKIRNIKKIKCSLCENKKYIESIINVNVPLKYDYSLINEYNFKTKKTKLPIICKSHGVFYQQFSNHFYLKQECPKCNGGIKLDLEDIKKRTKYEVINYNNGTIELNCQKHGKFLKRISKLNQGCPRCGNKSEGERKIRELLSISQTLFEEQKTFSDCKYKRKLPFDFYLPNHNICIEYDGIQHFEPIFGDNEFELTKIRDNIKNIFCMSKNIRLLRIPYTDFEKIPEILDQNLKNEENAIKI